MKWIVTALALSVSFNASADIYCSARAESIVRQLVHWDHQVAPDLCENFDRRDCLEVGVWTEQNEGSVQIDSVYYFGGNYPNQDTYSIKLDRECKVISIQVNREG